MSIDLSIFVIVLTVNLIIAVFSNIFAKEKKDKILLIILNFSMYIYSGFGLCLFEIANTIVAFYLLFIAVLNIVIVYCLNKKPSVKIIDYQKTNNFLNSKKGITFVNVMVILLFGSIIIQLISLGVGLNEFLNLKIFDLTDIFIKEANVRENFVTYLFNLIQNILIPFLFVKIYYLVKDKKKFLAIILFLMWVYLDALKIGYIGRYKMVIFVLFLSYLIFVKDGVVAIRKFIPIVIILILSIPLLLAYEGYRQGIDISFDYDFVNSSRELIEKEVSFPKYYNQIINTKIMEPEEYFIWLFTVSIPKKIFPVETVSINDEFSFLITGLRVDDLYYSIILPSIFGEAMLIYGLFFSWIHAIVLGLFLTIFIKYYKKFTHLSFLTVYLIIYSISIGRGGSQGVIAYFINISILFFIFSFFIKYFKIDEIKEVSNENISDFNYASR